MFSKKLRALAFFLMTLMVFYVIPVNCMQDIVTALSTDESVSTVEETETSLDEEPYVLGEDLSKREESAKHFRMSDGSYVAVQYAEPVHYLDSDGTYVEYDNTLSLSQNTSSGLIGNLQSGNLTTENITAINGYKANKSDVSITLANSASQSKLTSISKGEYSVSIIPLSLNTSSKVVVNNTTAKPTLSSKPTIEEASKLYNHTSSVKYTNLFNGADLEYVLSGSKLKENIIVNEKASSYVYSFNLNLTGLYAVLNEDGSISLIGNNTDKIEFTIPKGYMFDAAGNYSENVTYTLTSKPNGNYTLTVTADSEWINSDEIVFPVTVDPTISYRQTDMISVALSSDGQRTKNSYIKVGQNNTTKYESYWKATNLPTVPANAYINDVTLTLNYNHDGTIPGSQYIYAYQPASDWDQDTVQYNVINTNVIAYFKLDTSAVTDAPCHALDITELAKSWFSGGNNYGLLLRSDATTLIKFEFSANNSIGPILTVKYIQVAGLEDYWTYTSHSAADAGTGAVNLANGSLVFNVGTISTTDYIMPYMPVLTYNSGMASKLNTHSNANVPYVGGTAGYGFKWSMSESIVKKTYSTNVDGMGTYYIYSDSDGTEHAFSLDTKTNKIVDEDGLGLELTVGTSQYEIKYPDKTIKTFKMYAASSTMKEGAVLSSIIDPNGNKVTFTLNTYGRVSTIKIVPNGSSTATQLSLIHNNSGMVSRILNADTQQAAIFYYSSSQSGGTPTTSSGGYLRKIVYAHQTGSTDTSNWSDFMTNGSNQYITVDSTVQYTYSSGLLIRAQNDNAKTALDFSYSSKKVASVCERATAPEDEEDFLQVARQIRYSYGNNFSKVRTAGVDNTINNSDDIISVYNFDRSGRQKSTYSYKADITEVYGGAGYVYENEGGDYAELDRVKNNLKSSSVAGGNDTNYLLNGDFENVFNLSSSLQGTWAYSYASIVKKTKDEMDGTTSPDDISNNVACISVTSGTIGYIEQSVLLNKGNYTVSFQTYKEAQNYDLASVVRVKIYYNSVLRKEEVVSVSSIWATESVSFEISSQAKITVRIEAERPSDLTEIENIYVDDVMLNANSTSAEYSLVQNGNFENTYYNSSGVLTDMSNRLWSGESINFDSIYSNGINLFGRSLEINGNITEESRVSQVVYTFNTQTSSGEPIYLTSFKLKLSGYGYGTNQVIGTDSKFALCVTTEHQGNLISECYLDFNPNLEGEWQFVSGIVDCDFELNAIEKITVSCVYDRHPGNAYFDNISLSIVPASEKEKISYYTDKDKNGYEKVKTSSVGNVLNYYEYDGHDNVIKHVISKGNDCKLYNYIYDENGVNLLKQVYFTFTSGFRIPDHDNDETFADVEENLTLTFKSCTEYEYNSYGLCESTKAMEYYTSEDGEQFGNFSALPLCNYTEYVTTSGSNIFGALKQTTDSLGNTTKYFYDSNKGLLLSEVYSDGTGLGYEYDARNRLVLTVPVTYNASTNTATNVTTEEKVNYTYDSKGYLSQISTNSTTYTFTYDYFGNSDTIKAGGNVLANYDYNSNNGNLESLTYGNGTKVEYTYDSLDRVKEICYTENGGSPETLYEYFYTNEGYLKRFDNNIENVSIIYSYDGAGRLTHTVECSQDESDTYYSVEYYYDKYDRLDKENSQIAYVSPSGENEYTIRSEYSYDVEGKLEKVNVFTPTLHGTFSSTYDNLNRVSSRSIVFKDKTKTTTYFNNTVNYTFEDNGTTSTSTRVKTYQSTVGNTTKTYTYNYDDAGYITSVYNGTSMIYDYEYDDQGQITIFNDNSIIYGYYYDKAGNITYRYEDRLLLDGTIVEYDYTYGDSQWGDLLTAFNGNTITYDTIGNPLQYYNGNVFTWKQGRRLATVSNGSLNVSYDYDENGIRTSKTVNGVEHKYILNGSQIVAETWSNHIVIYLYDEIGSPVGMVYRNSSMSAGVYETYFFEKNMFGDILSVYNTSGVKQVSYNYDAFGNFTQTVHVSGTKATYNCLLYRGYYYDSETEFYYLNSRYYDPNTCRFISADGYVSTGQGLLGYNMFAYCNNNPVMYVDPNGDIGFLAGAFLVGVLLTVLMIPASSDLSEEFENAAREKYNEETINIVDSHDKVVEGKVNVIVKTTGYNEENPNIIIMESHRIRDEYEMEAIIDYIMSHEMYDSSIFKRSKNSYIYEWVAHNFAYDFGNEAHKNSAKNVDLDEKDDDILKYAIIYYAQCLFPLSF